MRRWNQPHRKKARQEKAIDMMETQIGIIKNIRGDIGVPKADIIGDSASIFTAFHVSKKRQKIVDVIQKVIDNTKANMKK